MAKESKPILHILVGPNGAGKSTLYEDWLKDRLPGVEFVNADELARKHYGHAAQTLEESQTGQRLADERRQALMAERKSLITESTFSHPSKLDLVRYAKASDYRVAMYHVNVRDATVSVDRVTYRVGHGGHPVPENKIRDRYERNQALIHEAVKLADRAFIFDNSIMGQPHRLAMELQHGEIIHTGPDMPAWAQALYKAELSRYETQRRADAVRDQAEK